MTWAIRPPPTTPTLRRLVDAPETGIETLQPFAARLARGSGNPDRASQYHAIWSVVTLREREAAMPLEHLSAEPTSRLPTLGDVAALAGVSRSTVSNVVRGSDVVAPRTRRRVAAAIEQLGYRPNALARQLLRGRASTVGVIARDLRNPFTAEMASFVER